MLRVIKYFAKSLKVIRNDTLEKDVIPINILLKLYLYVVLFLIYSALNSGVTLKFRFGVVQGD